MAFTLKPYCNQFTVKLQVSGLISMQTKGSLVGIHAATPKEAVTSLVAPLSHSKVKQFYVSLDVLENAWKNGIDVDDLYTKNDCESAVIIKDKVTQEETITVVPKDSVAEILKSSLPKNVMNLTIHTKAEADEAMYPLKDAQAFVFYPAQDDPDDVQNYQILVGLLEKSDLALCSVVNLQNHEGLFRLSLWRGRVTLVKQGFPDGINPHPSPVEGEFKTAPIPEANMKKLVDGFTKLAEPLNPDTYRDRIIAEKLDLKAAVDSGEVVVVAESEAPSASSLDALLAAFD